VKRKKAPSVYAYLDARKYLRDFYAFKKTEKHGYSYRVFCRSAGLKSPNYLKLVIDNARSLSSATARKFAQACGLGARETEYFLHLVDFTQASDSKQKSAAYERLNSFREYQRAHQLQAAEAHYFSKWYLPAIRELALRTDFRCEPLWVARALEPPITVREAKQALEVLKALQLLTQNAAGCWVPRDRLITTGAETTNVHMAEFHRSMMARASAAIDLFGPEDRDLSALTLAVNAEGMRQVKTQIQMFRRALLELTADQPNLDRVIQVNFQMFPLTKKPT